MSEKDERGPASGAAGVVYGVAVGLACWCAIVLALWGVNRMWGGA